jgi:hemerythrin
MSLITWTKEQFATNVSLHDKEHQTLFDLLNRLHTAVATGNRAITGPALDSLIDFVAKHFASEERNMSKTGYAGYAAHKAEHDKLVETCLDLQKKIPRRTSKHNGRDHRLREGLAGEAHPEC